MAAPPVLVEKVTQRIDHLVRLGRPFTLNKDFPTQELMLLVQRVPQEEKYGKADAEFLNLLANLALKKKRFSGRLFKRWDRTNERYERRGQATVYYPSNDRDRYHLGSNETFVPHRVSKETEKRECEPPLRLSPSVPPVRPSLTVEQELEYWKSLAVHYESTNKTLSDMNKTLLGLMSEFMGS